LIEPVQRVTALVFNIRPNDSAAARFAGFDRFSKHVAASLRVRPSILRFSKIGEEVYQMIKNRRIEDLTCEPTPFAGPSGPTYL
jgi:hypothetical protein